MKHKKSLLIDFDGTIHSYKSGWQGPRNIPDDPVPGAIKWLDNFIMFYCDVPESIGPTYDEREWEVVIFSSRVRYWGAVRAMKKWFVKHGLDSRMFEVIKWAKKPAHNVILDDRAMTFNGTFPQFSEVAQFKPWNKRNA